MVCVVGYFVYPNPLPIDHLSTYACLEGGAGFFYGDWFYAHWITDYQDLADQPIWKKELFSVVIVVRRWAPAWSNKHLIVHTDNMVTMYILNKGTSYDKTVMSWLREVF